jgi:hypothetical protein
MFRYLLQVRYSPTSASVRLIISNPDLEMLSNYLYLADIMDFCSGRPIDVTIDKERASERASEREGARKRKT